MTTAKLSPEQIANIACTSWTDTQSATQAICRLLAHIAEVEGELDHANLVNSVALSGDVNSLAQRIVAAEAALSKVRQERDLYKRRAVPPKELPRWIHPPNACPNCDTHSVISDGPHHYVCLHCHMLELLDTAEAALCSRDEELDEAVKMLRVLNEETVLAGLPGGDRNQTLANVRTLRSRDEAVRELLKTSQALLSTMETCHICKGALMLEESPVHCEDCSFDCEGHEEPECTPLYVLHAQLRAAAERLEKIVEGK